MQVVALRRGLPVLAAASVAGYAWWVTGLRPFTWPTMLAVQGAGLLVLGAAWRRYFPTAVESVPRKWPRGVQVWVVLVALFVGWELAAWVQNPRADHPTVSWMLGNVLEPQPLRAVVFVGWLAVGYQIGRR